MPRPEAATVPMKQVGFRLHQPPVADLGDALTPLDRVFFVYHMGVPALDPAAWRLTVGGLVAHPLALSLADLAGFAPAEVTAFHECAGSPLRPTEPVRRVANVTWRGVRLRDVLARAGVDPAARFLWSEGADHGAFAGVESECYRKDLPIAETLRDDVLLATHLNGTPLADERGGPVRLVVPGYYGTNSTKWLMRLEAQRERAPGHFTTTLYNDRVVEDGRDTTRPVWRVAPHAVIVAPADGAALPRAPLTIQGWAWGAEPIARVAVSTDDGATWADADLAAREGHGWQGFALDWTPPGPGVHALRCRATDRTGAMQPESGARNAVFRIEISVT